MIKFWAMQFSFLENGGAPVRFYFVICHFLLCVLHSFVHPDSHRDHLKLTAMPLGGGVRRTEGAATKHKHVGNVFYMREVRLKQLSDI